MKRYNTHLPKITCWLLLLLFRKCSVAIASNLRILPLGDSITFGKGTLGGYRSPLYYGLKTKGYNVDFVGSQITNCIWGEDVSIDCNHEGHLGWTIDMTREHIEQLLDQSPDPDAILLMIGTMDLTENDFNSAIDRWESLISKIVELRPHTHIFASNLIKRRDDDLSNMIDQYFNSYVEDVVQNFADNKRLVHFVDMNTALNGVDFIDALNPSAEGYELMAKEWLSHITSIFQPSGDNYPPSIVRAVGWEDRNHVTITFSKSLNLLSSYKDNFEADNNLEILDATLDDDERSITLTTSKQYISTVYTIKVSKGLYDQSSPPIMTDPESSISFRVGWRFLTLSDWHNAEKYVFGKRPKDEVNDVQVISYLKKNFGGELVLSAGDTNSGPWYRSGFSKALNNVVGSNLEPAEVVMEAGRRCYSGLMKSFRLGGFWNLLMAVGDHELGDNSWKKGSLKSSLVPHYRRAFSDYINTDYDGNFRFQENIGDTESRPFSTPFSETSYAYIHKNVLFVTIDEWYQKGPNSYIGDEGTVAGTVLGKHLEWFDNVLAAGRAHPKVKHIFVQGHLPILQPVRKVRSSGMSLEDGTNSKLWKTMQKHKVDIYWAGEVHLNTVSKDPDSNLIQVVSRGNYFTNFITVDVTDDLIKLDCHSETGANRWMYNYDYESCGSLQLRKENDELTIIESTGDLEVLDPSKPLIHFDFEETYPLESRKIQQLGDMKYVAKTPTVQKVYIQKTPCTEVLPNVGQFGINYDAQMSKISLKDGRNGKVGRFDVDSKAAVWGMGPHSEGNTVSCALWFRTYSSGNVILISYEGYWMKPTVMNLRLQEGTIEMVYSETQKIRGVGVIGGRLLNDGSWHHVAISMPDDNCFLSEIFLYVDGEQATTKIVGSDTTVYLPRGGQLALGGFGYGGTAVVVTAPDRKGFRDGINFLGEMDDVMVWSRTLELSEIQNMAKVIANSIRSSVSDDRCIGIGSENDFQGLQLLPCTNFPVQRWIMDYEGYVHNQKHYDYCMGLMNKNTAVGTNVVLTKCSGDTPRWSYLDKGLIQLSDYPDLVISSDDNGYIKILPYGSADNKVWIIGNNKK